VDAHLLSLENVLAFASARDSIQGEKLLKGTQRYVNVQLTEAVKQQTLARKRYEALKSTDNDGHSAE